jgi:phosphate transport system substrate-binding protein
MFFSKYSRPSGVGAASSGRGSCRACRDRGAARRVARRTRIPNLKRYLRRPLESYIPLEPGVSSRLYSVIPHSELQNFPRSVPSTSIAHVNSRLRRLWLLGSILIRGDVVAVVLLLALQTTVEPVPPDYAPQGKLQGLLQSVGSDSLNNLMTFWAQGFNRFYPDARIQIAGKGSSSVPPRLGKETPLVPMSRPMKEDERAAFQERTGYPPMEIRVAVDAVAVFVSKDNPVQGLSLQQVDAIFSKARRRGGVTASTWGDLGMKGEWAGKSLSLYGRNSASGVHGFFKELALERGDFKDEVKEQPGSAAVVAACAGDPLAMGYCSVGYGTTAVRAVPIDGIPATPDNCRSGKYPLSRFLYLDIDHDPKQPWDPFVREFVRYALSREGQSAVPSDGYYSLPADVLRAELKKLD